MTSNKIHERASAAFAIVGGGKVGISLGRQLLAAGYRSTGISCRTAASAEKAATLTGIPKFTDQPWRITSAAGIIFITTPDSAIASTCQAIAANQGFSSKAVVLHCSGALPSTILEVPPEMDIARGSLHPLQSFATVTTKENPFQGIIAAIEGDPRAVETARAIGETVGAACFTIKTEAKSLYHAAAVTASNYLVTLIEAALTLLEAAGIDRADAFTILAPLLRGTLANIEQAGTIDALTGPVARGDAATIEAHQKNIAERVERVLPLYNLMGRYTVPIALAKGTITKDEAEKMRTLFLNRCDSSGD